MQEIDEVPHAAVDLVVHPHDEPRQHREWRDRPAHLHDGLYFPFYFRYNLYGTRVIGTLQTDITLRHTMANRDIANCEGSPHAYDRRFQLNPGSNTTPTMTTLCPDVTLVALLGRTLL